MPTDPNLLATKVVNMATGEDAPEPPPAKPRKPKKDAAAVALGRKGGLKGGKARAASLTPEQRKAIAQKAAKARWSADKS